MMEFGNGLGWWSLDMDMNEIRRHIRYIFLVNNAFRPKIDERPHELEI
jgi:hypothetical protein